MTMSKTVVFAVCVSREPGKMAITTPELHTGCLIRLNVP